MLKDSAKEDHRGVSISFWKKVFKEIIKPALVTIRFLLVIMLSVSFAVLVLEASGLLHYIAKFMDPLMHLLGLPGEASLAFLSSMLINVYSAIAVIQTLALSGKQLIILSAMCLIAHNFFVECFVMKKTGSHLKKIVFLRIVSAIVAAWVLHFIVPEGAGPETTQVISGVERNTGIGLDLHLFAAMLLPWLLDSLFAILRIFLIVFAVMFLQKVLTELGVMKKLGRVMNPLIVFFGLSANTGYVWIIAYTVGVAYGAGVLIEEVKAGNLSRSEADIFNHHAAISHSQIEDTLLLVSTGVPYVWAALPRFILAIIVVWLERARRAFVRNSFRVKIVKN
jgi:spore maturation protein SpmB